MDKQAMLLGMLRLGMQKRAAGMSGVEKIEQLVAKNPDALSKTSPMEWGMRIAGGTGGALLGYWLAGKIHSKPRKLTRLLYALGGGATGAYLGDALVSDKARLHSRLENAFGDSKEYRDAVNEAKSNGKVWETTGKYAGGALGATVAGIRAANKYAGWRSMIGGKWWALPLGAVETLIGGGLGHWVGGGVGSHWDNAGIADVTGKLFERGMRTN